MPSPNENELREVISLPAEEKYIVSDDEKKNAASSGATPKISPIDLEFRDLTYKVKVKNPDNGEVEDKVILDHVSGYARGGELLAIMGSSGAGKTTLLNALSRRISEQNLSGSVTLNGVEGTRKIVNRNSGYIMQSDVLLQTMTPREALTFAAKLRLAKGTSDEAINARVEDILSELSLQKCADTFIGGVTLRGLSGGERKRVCIGVDGLITNPPVLFVDEPTSGLDSFMAKQVVEALKRVARSGRTVICTIHQPNSQIFQMFDRLYLLAKGRCIYAGAASGAEDYFEQLGYPTPASVAPADFFMELMYENPESEEDRARVHSLITHSQQMDPFAEHKVCPLSKDGSVIKHHGKGDQISVWAQSKLLLHRSFLQMRRDMRLVCAKLGQATVVALIYSFLFFNLGNDQTSIQNRSGLMFMGLMFTFMSSMMQILHIFPAERPVFLRERGNHMYAAFSYYFGRVVSDIPIQCCTTLIFSTLIYWIAGLRNDFEHYIFFLCILLLMANVGSGIGFCMGAACANAEIAMSLTPLILMPFTLVAGFVTNNDSLIPPFTWFQYVSPLKYGYDALAINEFKGATLDCSSDEVCSFTDGSELLDKRFAIDEDMKWPSLFVLVGFFFAFRILAFIILRQISKKKSSQ
eukprot:GCRY01001882.1.p1 GENE.GCRY01001882.1~~GCRY01001882.1.p1  ORF type:complete len:638 (+),score=182.31 GCRY01001882.1:183-2096(+)